MDQIVLEDDIKRKDLDCIIILGAGLRFDGTPSLMLEDRLKMGLVVASLREDLPIIVSGDHGEDGYNEVGAMKTYLIENGIASNRIFMDHAGFSTYDSMYRLSKVFEVKKAVVITQQFHLYRALYIANKLGIEAYGVSATLRYYSIQPYNEQREFLARNKDFVKALLKPPSIFIGDAIDVMGDGDLTND